MTQDSRLRTQNSFNKMGKIGFMFFAAVGIWVVTAGSGGYQQPVAVWPDFTEAKATVAAASAEVWQTVLLELLPAKLLP